MERDAVLKNDAVPPNVPVSSPLGFLRERPSIAMTEDYTGILYPKEQWCCNQATD